MLGFTTNVFIITLVTTLLSEKCICLQVPYNNDLDNALQISESLSVPESKDINDELIEVPVTQRSGFDHWKSFFGQNKPQNGLLDVQLDSEQKSEESSIDERENEIIDVEDDIKHRVVRQAYHGQTGIYPNLPPNPYNQYPTSTNNQQWGMHNSSQPGYPPNGNFNTVPSNPSYGNSPFNPHQPNYPNQYPNNSPSSYPAYRPNSTYSNPGNFPYGPTNNAYNGQRPTYNTNPPSNIHHVNNNNNNHTNWASGQNNHSAGPYSRPQYGQISQHGNSYPANIYWHNSSYPTQTPFLQPHYYPGKNNTGFHKPGYPNNNVTTWPGHQNTFHNYPTNNTFRPIHNNGSSWPQGGQHNVPGMSPYGQKPPYNVQPQYPIGQYGNNGFPGASSGTSFNPGQGYNPSNPNPYGTPYGGQGQAQLSYPSGYGGGNNYQDPNKVSPGHLSYPH